MQCEQKSNAAKCAETIKIQALFELITIVNWRKTILQLKMNWQKMCECCECCCIPNGSKYLTTIDCGIRTRCTHNFHGRKKSPVIISWFSCESTHISDKNVSLSNCDELANFRMKISKTEYVTIGSWESDNLYVYCTCVHINFTMIPFRTHNRNNNVHAFMYTRIWFCNTPSVLLLSTQQKKAALLCHQCVFRFISMVWWSKNFLVIRFCRKSTTIVLHSNVHDEITVYVFVLKYVVAGFHDWTNMALSTQYFRLRPFCGCCLMDIFETFNQTLSIPKLDSIEPCRYRVQNFISIEKKMYF